MRADPRNFRFLMETPWLGQGQARALIALCLAALVLLGATGRSCAQLEVPFDPTNERLYAYRAGAVRIAPDPVTGGNAEEGWGLVVGDRNNVLTIATPAHVVWGKGMATPTNTPQVFLLGQDPGSPLRAATAVRIETADLAVLTVPKPLWFTALRIPVVATDDLHTREKVWHIGHDRQWDASGPGYYQNQDGDGRLRISGLPAPPGSSGGLALTEYGALGMVLQFGGTGGATFILPAEQIVRLLDTDEFRRAGVSVNLLSTQAQPPARPLSQQPTLARLIVGPGIGPPKPLNGATQWQTIPSISYPRPKTRTTLVLSAGSGRGGPATVDDTELRHAEGSYEQKGWTIEFQSLTQPQICALGEIYGDTRTGLNIMTFQMWRLYCRGAGPCTCFGGNAVLSQELRIYETLVQFGANAPQLLPNPPPAPPIPSQRQIWEFNYNGRDVRVTVDDDGAVTFSPTVFGGTGKWEQQRNSIYIRTPSHTIAGSLYTGGYNSGRSMAANVHLAGSATVIATIMMNRVDTVGSNFGEPSVFSGGPPIMPDMNPAMHMAGQSWSFDTDGRPLVVSFGENGQATLSDPRYGSMATWQPLGSTVFQVRSPTHVLTGNFEQNGNGEVTACKVVIGALDRRNPPYAPGGCRRVR
jgi:hypothetical protein